MCVCLGIRKGLEWGGGGGREGYLSSQVLLGDNSWLFQESDDSVYLALL
jgi:hypothetical protein